MAFYGHNGLQIHNLSGLRDRDTITTITIRKQGFRGELSYTVEGHVNVVNSVVWKSNDASQWIDG